MINYSDDSIFQQLMVVNRLQFNIYMSHEPNKYLNVLCKYSMEFLKSYSIRRHSHAPPPSQALGFLILWLPHKTISLDVSFEEWQKGFIA